ncbi:MAG TPA: aminomethyltransferase beta-barrel domain-containing protein [Thalassobaculum sp.]
MAAGQAAVLYGESGTRVLGGGWIRGVEGLAPSAAAK